MTILRDTAASRSIILDTVLPLSDKTSLDSSELVQGFGMGFVNVPLHCIELESALVSGKVVVATCSAFPIKGVDFLLGNDLAWGKILASPQVTAVPVVTDGPDDLQKEFPTVFPVCAVTRAMANRQAQRVPDGGVVPDDCAVGDPDLVNISEKFTAGDVSSVSEAVSGVLPDVLSGMEENPGEQQLSRQRLILEQSRDSSLSSLHSLVLSGEDIEKVSSSYFLKHGVLMRKWHPPFVSKEDDWSIVLQIVVPQVFRSVILGLAHDNPLAGHLGVNKTYNRILRHFFWPGLKRDVRQYCKTCHVCQVSGKPAQTPPPYPLCPIPAVESSTIRSCFG